MSQMGGLLLLCAFGIVSSLTLYYNEGLRESKWINAIYSAGFVLFNVLYWLGVYSSMGGLEGNGAAGFKVVGFVLLAALGWAVGWACNVAAVYWVMQYYLSVFVRDVSGLDQIVVRKTFDRAEAAEARADYEKAAALYAEEIAAEPLDREAHRRLGTHTDRRLPFTSREECAYDLPEGGLHQPGPTENGSGQRPNAQPSASTTSVRRQP